jgi:hypothetical protein
VYKKLRRTFEKLDKKEKLAMAALSQALISILSLLSLIPNLRMDIGDNLSIPIKNTPEEGCAKKDFTVSGFIMFLEVINAVVESVITFQVPATFYIKMCQKMQYESKMLHFA